MERSASPVERSSSPVAHDAPRIEVQDEPALMDSPVASPTTTLSTTAPDPTSPLMSPSIHHKKTVSGASSSSSLQGSQGQQSGDPIRRRHTHRNSSFEYKETLDATTRHLEDGSRIINQYRLLDMIGQGAYGNVYAACLLQDPSVKFAVKEFGKTRLRKTHRAANLRKPIGRGGVRARGGFAARGARGGTAGVGEVGDKMAGLSIEAERVGAAKADAPKPEPNTEDPLSLIRHEIAILKKLDHPHVVELYEVLDDPTKDGLYMVFEYCPDGRVIDVKLHEQVEPLDEDTARDYLVQIMLGIEYLHYNDILHRDIKPDNILLQDQRKTCKIVDFGVSEIFVKPGDDTLQKSAGSPAFMSPELCRANHGDVHGKYSDMWSLGVTFFCMVVGRLPFDKSHFLDLYEAITRDVPDYPSHLSSDCRDLLERLLDKEAEKRITFAEMRVHPFLTKQGTIEIMSEEENTSTIVVEVTDEEVDGAIKKIASVFTLARAISKFKRAGSRASSTSSLGDMAGHLLGKGKDLMTEAETNAREGHVTAKADEVSSKHMAAAHIALGATSAAHVVKDAAKSLMAKGNMLADSKQVESPELGDMSGKRDDYFAGKSEEAQDEKSHLLAKPIVGSPVSTDLPSPEGAAPAYKGKLSDDV